MPDVTPKLEIKKPLGNEYVTRQSFNENWDTVDQNAASQTELDTHKADQTMHITEEERTIWSEKETPTGAQEKANVVRDSSVNKYSAYIPESHIDPNTTPYPYTATQHPNCPNDTDLWHLRTYYHQGLDSDKVQTAQNAINNEMYIRYNHGTWSSWVKMLTENDVIQPTAENTSIEDSGDKFAATDVEGALSELFTNVSDGKTTLAAAITDMGQSALGNMTFAQLAVKVKDISKNASSTPSDVLTGRTAYAGGTKITGTMSNNGTKIITPSTTNQTIAKGYHNGQGYVVGDPDLKSENIKSGTTIFGVGGKYNPTFKWDRGKFESVYNQTLTIDAPKDCSRILFVLIYEDDGLRYGSSYISIYNFDGSRFYKENTTYDEKASLTLNDKSFTYKRWVNSHIPSYDEDYIIGYY
ncbi:pyocin knob domain-containing protein [Longirhabdus pacifica]|uniref:pyocin knob domain-containing protein n=1 Tax=Longirhabdus pacifica TaxID=2305227 RepID=UPI001008CAEB|nr:pyocin knob domain-containing protein [Longirhabdus pacifica]